MVLRAPGALLSAPVPPGRAQGVPQRCAVLGHPVGHSLSPLLHRAAYVDLGLDWTYDAVDVDAEGLPAFFRDIGVRDTGPRDTGGPASPWRGLSLTMPLKWAVLPLLDELDPVAATVGSVNTVVFGPHRPGADPLRRGANTDVAGVRAALAGRPTRSVVILGAGATACSVLAALPAEAEVTVLARDPARADRLRALADLLARPVAVGRLDGSHVGRDGTGRDGIGRDAVGERPQVLVSTLPGGAVDAALLSDLGPRVLPGPDGTVLDAVYAGWPTPLGHAGAVTGALVLSGLDLLVHQAAAQVRLMTGYPVAPAVLGAALVTAGVPGSVDLATRLLGRT